RLRYRAYLVTTDRAGNRAAAETFFWITLPDPGDPTPTLTPTATASPTPTLTPTPEPTSTPMPTPTTVSTLVVPLVTTETPTPEPTSTPLPTATPQIVIPRAPAPAIVVSGLVFHDTNADGMWDAATEPGLSPARVAITNSDESWIDSQEVDAHGWYTFTLPGPGTYTVYPVHVPPGYRYTTSEQVTFTVDAPDGGITHGLALDFGLNKRWLPWLFGTLQGLSLSLLVGVTVTGLRVREAILERSQIQRELAAARLEFENPKLETETGGLT
ncbi:MAG TPA: hypothetical protein EYP88_06340, partial [Anaerolineales bacterium]|nr:hypothetical protein [Anaerolineales bacterium]